MNNHDKIAQRAADALYFMGHGVPRDEAMDMAYRGMIQRFPYEGDTPRFSAQPTLEMGTYGEEEITI